MVDDMENQERMPAEQWLGKIRAALRREKPWRDDVKKTLRRYSLSNESGETENGGKFNILWSNTEVLRQAVYNKPPQPDVRQRFDSKDPVALAAAELLDRALTYQIDFADFHAFAERAVLDVLLCGRAVMRVRYSPEFSAEGFLIRERLAFENVAWNDFVHDEARYWEKVDWIAFRHTVTRDEFAELFPEYPAEKVSFTASGNSDKDDDWKPEQDSPDTAKRLKAQLWEVWSRREGAVVWVSPGCDEVIAEEEPPLRLEGFYPIARPVIAIDKPDSLMPQPLYMQYQEQAAELDRVSDRISRLVRAVKWRGLYDATLGDDLGRVFSEAQDGDLIPTSNSAAIMEMGGVRNAFYLIPIEQLVAVLQQLYVARDQSKQTIYEITGISDVLRGETNPNETATAQQIKANWGGNRVAGLSRKIQWGFSDVLRLAAEIMAENFDQQTLSDMTGMTFPTKQEQQQAQMQAQQVKQAARAGDPQARQQGQQIVQKAQAIMGQPAWEDVLEVLHSDRMRSFKVDIETDSTIAPNQKADMEELEMSMSTLDKLMKSLTQGIQAGVLSADAGKQLLNAVVRKLPMQNAMIPALDEQGPDPMRKQLEQMKKKMDEMKAQLQSRQQEHQLKQQELQLEATKAQQEHQLDAAELQLKAEDMRDRREADAVRAMRGGMNGQAISVR